MMKSFMQGQLQSGYDVGGGRQQKSALVWKSFISHAHKMDCIKKLRKNASKRTAVRLAGCLVKHEFETATKLAFSHNFSSF